MTHSPYYNYTWERFGMITMRCKMATDRLKLLQIYLWGYRYRL